MLRRGPLLFGCAILSAVGFLPALTPAQTKITIGVAAMSPRTIPLLLAKSRDYSPSMASKRALS